MKLQILFGGELAHSVSERVTSLMIESGHEITACLCMSEFKKANPELTTIYIVQTIENNEAPEPATRFFSFVKNKSHPEDLFSKLQYTVIALGDSNLLLDRQVRPISLQYYFLSYHIRTPIYSFSDETFEVVLCPICPMLTSLYLLLCPTDNYRKGLQLCWSNN